MAGSKESHFYKLQMNVKVHPKGTLAGRKSKSEEKKINSIQIQILSGFVVSEWNKFKNRSNIIFNQTILCTKKQLHVYYKVQIQ